MLCDVCGVLLCPVLFSTDTLCMWCDGMCPYVQDITEQNST